MNFVNYQVEAERTANSELLPNIRILVSALGLAGEAGEVGNIIKKQIGHKHDYDTAVAKLKDELGDVLWYIADLANAYQLDLNEIAVQNVGKLRRRFPNGFSSEASINRQE